jgi:hypothetical protein
MVSSEPRSERPRGSHFCPNSTVSGSERTVSREMQAFKEVVRFETDAGAKAEAMLSAERRRAAVFMLFLLICERLVVTAHPFLAQRTSSWIFEGRAELFVDSQMQSYRTNRVTPVLKFPPGLHSRTFERKAGNNTQNRKNQSAYSSALVVKLSTLDIWSPAVI